MKRIRSLFIMLLVVGFLFQPVIVLAVDEETGGAEETPMPLTHLITFQSDGGSSVSEQQVATGGKVSKPEDPTKEGFTFVGWYLEDGTLYDFDQPVDGPFTLIAHWEKVAPNSSYLASLSVTGFDMDQDFTRTNETYTMTVPANTESITVVAVADENSDVLQGNGSHTLKDGENVITIITKLKGTNDKEKTYTLTVTREAPDVSLDSLRVSGYALKEAFQKDVLQYTMEVPYEVESLNVMASASSDQASVRVEGANQLEVGENEVRIVVTYVTGTSQVYTITVTRLAEDEEGEVIPEASEPVTSSIVAPPTQEESKESGMKYILITIVCALVLVLAGVAIFFFIKTRKNKKTKDKDRNNHKTEEKSEKVVEELTTDEVEEVPEVEVVEEDPNLEITKEAPSIDHDDILDGMDDLL